VVVTARLHVIAGSHPCACAEAALGLKGMPYRRVELPSVLHAVPQRIRYGRRTVPGLTLDGGEKVAGSVAILRRLEELVPRPALYPDEPEARRRVEDAEAWGEEVLQETVRRIDVALFRRRPDAFLSYTEGSTVPLPRWLMRASVPTGTRLYARMVGVEEDAAGADARALPGHLDRVDELIAAGTIGGEAPNAADLQIGASIRQLTAIADVEPLLAGRPALALGRHFPPMIGHIPAGTAPPGWF
jgi:glutathione S-transferase